MIGLQEHRGVFRKALIASFIEQQVVRSGFEGMFPRKAHNAEMLSVEVQRNEGLVAVDVMRCTNANRNTFSKSTEKLFKPPFYKESFDFTCCQGYAGTYGAGILPSGSSLGNIARSSQMELNALRNKVERAIELQRAQVLQTGVVVLKNGDSIDYKRKAASMKSVTNKWNTAGATIRKDFEEGMKFLREEGSSADTTINAIFGGDAFANFMQNEALKKEYDIKHVNRGEIHMPQFDNSKGMALHGQFAAGDFTVYIWTYNETYIDPVTGDRKPYLDKDTVVMVPSDFIGETSFATTPVVRGDGQNRYIAQQEGEYTIYDIIDPEKTAWDVILQSAPLVVPVTVDRIYTMKTV